MVEELVAKNFNENISYLEREQPELFATLVALESAIEKGHFQEKYQLVDENGYFDVYAIESQSFLYGKSSEEHAKLAQKSINYEVLEDTFNCLSKESCEESIQVVINMTQDTTSSKKVLQKLHKFIFFGVGLGRHIEAIDSKISSSVYLIIEDDLELFRLSLFTMNYAILASKAELVFSVFESKDEFAKKASYFLDKEYQYNHYIKYFYLLSHSEEKIVEFQRAVASQAHLSFLHKTYLQHSLTPLTYIQKEYKFLTKEISLSNEYLDSKPYLLLAAGPSLEKNREWLMQNSNKFIIVAVVAVLDFLQEAKIFPDIIIHLDAHKTSLELLKNINSLDLFEKTICLFSDKIPLDFLNKFNKNNIFLFENGTRYKENSFKPSAPCVGSIAYQILIYAKVRELYLLGLDMSLDAESHKTHIDSYSDMKVENPTVTLTEKDNLYTAYVKREGNFRENVYTNSRWLSSVENINYVTQSIKKVKQNCYNLSDGIRFESIKSKRKEVLSIDTIIDKGELQKKIYTQLMQTVEIGFSKSESTHLAQSFSEAKKLYLEIKSMKEDIDFQKIQSYTTRCLSHDSILYRVINIYLRTVMAYITQTSKEPSFAYSLVREEIEKILDSYIGNISCYQVLKAR